ncbi:MAG TPA: nuclear transport factor 2 family protein [Acidimicrobiales bacterium]|nr:nuclear transport factor 2 family protein [Acidimicrobiales bacterium]
MENTEEGAAGLADLRRRVRRTEDVLAIQHLKARYAELVDARYRRGALVPEDRMSELTEEIAGLFAEDGEWDGGPVLGRSNGRRAIAERLAHPTLLFSRHLFVNPQIQVDGDEAWARWELLCPCTTADGRPHWMSGYEEDRYVRQDGRWLHARMRLTTVFFAPAGDGWPDILA